MKVLTDREKIEQGREAEALLGNDLLNAMLDEAEEMGIDKAINTEDDAERRVYAYQARFARNFRQKLLAKAKRGKATAEQAAQ